MGSSAFPPSTGELLLNPKDVLRVYSDAGHSHCRLKLKHPVKINPDCEPEEFLVVQESHAQVREKLMRACPGRFE